MFKAHIPKDADLLLPRQRVLLYTGLQKLNGREGTELRKSDVVGYFFRNENAFAIFGITPWRLTDDMRRLRRSEGYISLREFVTILSFPQSLADDEDVDEFHRVNPLRRTEQVTQYYTFLMDRHYTLLEERVEKLLREKRPTSPTLSFIIKSLGTVEDWKKMLEMTALYVFPISRFVSLKMVFEALLAEKDDSDPSKCDVLNAHAFIILLRAFVLTFSISRLDDMGSQHLATSRRRYEAEFDAISSVKAAFDSLPAFEGFVEQRTLISLLKMKAREDGFAQDQVRKTSSKIYLQTFEQLLERITEKDAEYISWQEFCKFFYHLEILRLMQKEGDNENCAHETLEPTADVLVPEDKCQSRDRKAILKEKLSPQEFQVVWGRVKNRMSVTLPETFGISKRIASSKGDAPFEPPNTLGGAESGPSRVCGRRNPFMALSVPPSLYSNLYQRHSLKEKSQHEKFARMSLHFELAAKDRKFQTQSSELKKERIASFKARPFFSYCLPGMCTQYPLLHCYPLQDNSVYEGDNRYDPNSHCFKSHKSFPVKVKSRISELHENAVGSHHASCNASKTDFARSSFANAQRKSVPEKHVCKGDDAFKI